MLSNHSIVIADGILFSWGQNCYGQLGIGSSTDTTTPQPILNLCDIVEVKSGIYHSLALSDVGLVYSWGHNYYGQLGIGTSINSKTPQLIMNLTNILSIACGYRHSMALSGDGKLFLWGENRYGQLGNGSLYSSLTPELITIRDDEQSNDTTFDIISIACGGYHSMVLCDDGQLFSWGWNSYGQLGNGNTTNSSVPIQITKPINLFKLKSISCGSAHSMTLSDDGKVFSWGANCNGELGHGNTTNSLIPIQITSLTNIISISCSYVHSMGLTSDGKVFSWGANHHGQLGNGNTTDSTTPIQIATLTNIIDIMCCYVHSMALSDDGKLFLWGENRFGQLGNGNTNSKSIPEQLNLVGNNLKWNSSRIRPLMWEFQRFIWIGKFCQR